jgi:hypothetical protein
MLRASRGEQPVVQHGRSTPHATSGAARGEGYDNALNDARQIALLATNDDTGHSGAVLPTPDTTRGCGLGFELVVLAAIFRRLKRVRSH